jgi:alpha-glucosidase (family GH31 glycosyl hydrolase)
MPVLQSLKHSPYGLEHPYTQGPEERTPRQPLAGQPVILGAVTAPAGAAGAVWAEWSSSSGRSGRVEGAPLQGAAEGSSAWKVELPAFAPLEEVRYCLFAAGQAGGAPLLQSAEFSFTAAAWYPAGEVAGLKAGPGQVTLEFSGGEFTPRLALQFLGPAHLRLCWRASGEIQPPAAAAPYQVTHQDEACLTATTEALEVSLGRKPFQLSIRRRADGRVVFEQDLPPGWLLGEERRPLAFRQDFPCPAEESFYGFGERFNAFNQRGNQLDVCVFDQYRQQGLKTYIPVPFCLSRRGWGLHVNTSRRVAYDLAASQPERWSFEAGLGAQDAHGALDCDLFFGAPAEVVSAFSQSTGQAELPPAWVFGPWMSSNEWNTQAEVMRQVELTRRYNIPASVLVIEAWSDENTFYIWNDARYTLKPGGEAFSYTDFTFPADGKWPDPKGMIEALHGQGIRLVLWQIPVLKREGALLPQHELDIAHALQQGFCARNPDGTPYAVRSLWFNNGLLWDPTHPAGREWWLGKRAYLLDEMGVDGFKTDGGEHLWARQAEFAGGLRGDEAWNQYPNLYVSAYHEYSSRHRGGDAVTFSRAGFTGAQAHPCHWAGDQFSTWPEFRAVLRAGLSAGLSGIPFWGWDLAGFSGEVPTAELYLRAAAMAVFTPIMQYHSDFNEHRLPLRDRTPWNIAERSGRPEVIELYGRLARLRVRLQPYIEAEAAACAAAGLPLMRPLFLDWPGDPQAWQVEDQYCFGRALLVAPILEEGARQRWVYLPAGEWSDVWTGAVLHGPAWIDCPAEPGTISVFQRQGQPGPARDIWREPEKGEEA